MNICTDCSNPLHRPVTAGCIARCDQCEARRTADTMMRVTGSISSTATVGDATYTARH